MENLPQSTSTHDQERKSLIRLSNTVPVGLFILREEDGGDYGVDRILELRQDTTLVTNYRIHLQLKSEENAQRNTDGTYSYPVPISTINYLMNQSNSLFVVYLINEDVLVWEWVSAIFADTLSKNIDVKCTDQKTFSYRFHKELDNEAFKAIHCKVIESGGLLRSVAEFMSSTPNAEQLNAALLLKNGQFTDLDQQVAALKQGGIPLINSGHLGLVNAVLNALPSTCRTDPKVSMVYAYAKIHGGYAFDALSWLPKGAAREKLDADDRALAAYIELFLNYTLGIITREQYLRGLSKLGEDEKESVLGLQIKLERLKRTLTSKHGPEIQATVQEMKTTVEQLKARVGTDHALLIFTEILEWELVGWFIHFELVHKASDFRIKLKSGYIMPFSERLRQAQDMVARTEAWFIKYEELRERTKDSPATHGNVVITASTLIIHRLAQTWFLAEDAPVSDEKPLKEVIKILEAAEKFLLGHGLDQMAVPGY